MFLGMWLFFGSIFYILIEALLLQLSANLVVKNKPNYTLALGLSVAVYLLSIVILFSAVGVFFSWTNIMEYDFSVLQTHLVLVILLILFSALAGLAFAGWLYGSQLTDETGAKIGFWRGILVYILQYIFSGLLKLVVGISRFLFF